jgi:hypothetical protein
MKLSKTKLNKRKAILRSLKKLKLEIPYYPGISLLDIHPQECASRI